VTEWVKQLRLRKESNLITQFKSLRGHLCVPFCFLGVDFSKNCDILFIVFNVRGVIMTDNNENFEVEVNESEIIEKETSFNLLKEVWEWVYTIGLALLIAFVIKSYLFDIVRVDGPSMNPTLIHNDRLIITKLGYKPDYGDIVILDSTYKDRQEYYEELEESGKKINFFTKFYEYSNLPTELKKRFYVKRVIAMEGDTIDIINGDVILNGEVLEEDYFTGNTRITDLSVDYPVTVSEGHVFVMGDNRDNSKDSRSSSLGEVPVEALSGKAQLRVWPLASSGKLY